MEAGRELDALVAEKVMGYVLRYTSSSKYGIAMWSKDLQTEEKFSFQPSTTWEGMGLVVEKMLHLNPRVIVDRGLKGDKWYCSLGDGKAIFAYASANTAPHAICLAALKTSEKK